MKEFYETNEDFRRYVDRECVEHEKTVDQALELSWVRNAYEYYKDAEKGKISSTEIKVGCGCVDLEDKSC